MADVAELSWIEAYMVSEMTADVAIEARAAAEAPAEPAAEATAEVTAELAFATPPESTDASDDASAAWAIDDATEEIARLADQLNTRAPDQDVPDDSEDRDADAGDAGLTDAGPRDAASLAAARADAADLLDGRNETLGPWEDDESWMDIMPTLPNTGAGDLAAQTDWARAFGEAPAPLTPPMSPPSLPAGDVLAAAVSLESVAQRLRSGELDVPGYTADRGDAAALAAALAALLGVRG